MASMSSADKTYIIDMTSNHKAAIETAKSYLKAGPAERNANLSEMARMTIKDDMAQMAKMAGMMGKPMGGK